MRWAYTVLPDLNWFVLLCCILYCQVIISLNWTCMVYYMSDNIIAVNLPWQGRDFLFSDFRSNFSFIREQDAETATLRHERDQLTKRCNLLQV